MATYRQESTRSFPALHASPKRAAGEDLSSNADIQLILAGVSRVLTVKSDAVTGLEFSLKPGLSPPPCLGMRVSVYASSKLSSGGGCVQIAHSCITTVILHRGTE